MNSLAPLPSKRVAALACLLGDLLVQKASIGVAVRNVTLVAAVAGSRIGVLPLPLGEEYVEVVVEILPLGHRIVALQAICV